MHVNHPSTCEDAPDDQHNKSTTTPSCGVMQPESCIFQIIIHIGRYLLMHTCRTLGSILWRDPYVMDAMCILIDWNVLWTTARIQYIVSRALLQFSPTCGRWGYSRLDVYIHTCIHIICMRWCFINFTRLGRMYASYLHVWRTRVSIDHRTARSADTHTHARTRRHWNPQSRHQPSSMSSQLGSMAPLEQSVHIIFSRDARFISCTVRCGVMFVRRFWWFFESIDPNQRAPETMKNMYFMVLSVANGHSYGMNVGCVQSQSASERVDAMSRNVDRIGIMYILHERLLPILE